MKLEMSMPLETTGEPPFISMSRQMSKMMDQMQKGFFSFCPSETWTPAVNLYENDTVYLVCVDLSGVDKDKIDLTVAEGQLKLRGERKVPVQPVGTEGEARAMRIKVHLMEIDHGPFCREVELPDDAQSEHIAASYRDGMLWIEVPKRA
jgi:HSP20 family protein